MVSPYVYVGYNCNNNCIFCSEADRYKTKEPLDRIKQELLEIKKKYDFVNIMGREPTLRDDITEIIRYAKSIGFKQVGITTNGRLFAYQSFAKKILSTGIDQIVVSLQGHNAALHDYQTQVHGSFEQTVKGIKNLIKLNNKGISLLVNVVINQITYKQLQEIVSFIVSLGIKEINLLYVSPLSKRSRSKKIIPKISDVVPVIVNILSSYSKSKDVKLLFVELPPCFVPVEYRKHFSPCLENNPDKIKINFCRGCEYDKRCTGIMKYYFKLYGKNEFKKWQ